ncbi:hypothetical protein CVT25_013242 [Psilocybe cyanescens]|uniref:Uncharacterized protein n=1 Tax=Psilocybe cyanescens TaxID=93625 RepID=A0A409XLU9_PSICY|nr:hypothetical protein CVT25_013242 [Psilocybe cyanescens]
MPRCAHLSRTAAQKRPDGEGEVLETWTFFFDEGDDEEGKSHRGMEDALTVAGEDAVKNTDEAKAKADTSTSTHPVRRITSLSQLISRTHARDGNTYTLDKLPNCSASMK